MKSPSPALLSRLLSVMCPSRLLLLLVCVLLLLLQLARAAEGQQEVTTDLSALTTPVWYYTTRQHSGKQTIDDYYDHQRGEPRTGVCEVSDKYPALNHYVSRLPFHIPDIDKQVDRLTEFPETALWQQLAKAAAASAENDVVLYVHGYNISFEKACRRAATFQQVLGDHSRLLLFSWPSNGELASYTQDEADIEWSQHYLAAVLDRLLQIYGAGRVNVVAHSLGSRGAFRTLQLLAAQGAVGLVNELVLLAPDIDAGVFENALPRMRQVARRITLYTAQNDRPLMLSREVHGYPRLGESGDDMVVLEGIETIDVTNSGGRSLSGHLYHLYNDAVRADLCRLLSTGESAGQRPRLIPRERGGLTYWELEPIPADDA